MPVSTVTFRFASDMIKAANAPEIERQPMYEEAIVRETMIRDALELIKLALAPGTPDKTQVMACLSQVLAFAGMKSEPPITFPETFDDEKLATHYEDIYGLCRPLRKGVDFSEVRAQSDFVQFVRVTRIETPADRQKERQKKALRFFEKLTMADSDSGRDLYVDRLRELGFNVTMGEQIINSGLASAKTSRQDG